MNTSLFFRIHFQSNFINANSKNLFFFFQTSVKSHFSFRSNAIVISALGLIGAAGVSNPQHLAPRHIVRRINQVDIQSYDKMYPPVAPGCLLNGAETPPPGWLLDAWLRSADVDGTHTN